MSDQPVRRSRRRILVIAAVAVAAIGIALGGWAVAAGGESDAGQALVGTWRPTFIAGFNEFAEVLPDSATVTFGTDGKWHGSDGCNGIGGEYEAGAGTISAHSSGAQTLMGCANVPTARVLSRATRWDITANTLTLYDDQHATLATYVRT